MRLHHDGNRFILDSTYDERAVPKAARFRWDPGARCWWTDRDDIAAALAQHADDSARARLAGLVARKNEAVQASQAVDADRDIPAPPGLSYLPFQRAGIAYALARDGVLIGDEMGLGKTIQAVGILNAEPEAGRVLVICPASLKLNWQREMERWLCDPRPIHIIASKTGWPALGARDICIVNYDILHAYEAEIRAAGFDVLICDEAHRLKSRRARRTKMVLGEWDKQTRAWKVEPLRCRRRIMLTGTPAVNRPAEIWPLIQFCDRRRWNNWWEFVKRYCGAYQGRHGWDISGATNLDELQRELRASVMVRRLKSEVLTELPPKLRQIVEIAANGATRTVRAEVDALDRHEAQMIEARARVEMAKAAGDDEYQAAVAALADCGRVAFTEISALRHATAMEKAPHVAEHVADLLEDGTGKVIVMAHHLDVIARIAEPFGAAAVTLTGEHTSEQKQAAVDRFQADPECRVFVGSIQAAGVGITLTAASTVVFAELDWVPANMSQAEDRAHRIGQRASVLVQHLVFDQSIDARMARVLVEKQAVLDRMLDDRIDALAMPEAKEPALPAEGATTSTRRAAIQKAAENMTPERVAAVHLGLRMLAGVCDGAATLDGAGFSKLDTRLGHELAQRPDLSAKQAALGAILCTKYRRQLPADLSARIRT